MEQIKGEARKQVRRKAANAASKAVDAHNTVAETVHKVEDVAEAVVDKVEDVAEDVAEEVVEKVNAVRRFIGSNGVQSVIHHPKFPFAIGVVAVAAVGTAAYFYGKRNGDVIVAVEEAEQLSFFKSTDGGRSYESVYDGGPSIDEAVEQAIANAQDAEGKIGLVIDEDKYTELKENPADVGADFVRGTLSSGPRSAPPRSETVIDIPGEAVTTNVFAGADASDDGWDYQAELAKRTPRDPYVIHKDEFFEEETEYTQTTLTYYKGDGILADEDEKPVYNPTQVVGEFKWGHGSGGQPNVFYVRNDRLRTEYEVILFDGHYAIEVQGLEDETRQEAADLKHSQAPGKFRDR